MVLDLLNCLHIEVMDLARGGRWTTSFAVLDMANDFIKWFMMILKCPQVTQVANDFEGYSDTRILWITEERPGRLSSQHGRGEFQRLILQYFPALPRAQSRDHNMITTWSQYQCFSMCFSFFSCSSASHLQFFRNLASRRRFAWETGARYRSWTRNFFQVPQRSIPTGSLFDLDIDILDIIDIIDIIDILDLQHLCTDINDINGMDVFTSVSRWPGTYPSIYSRESHICIPTRSST